MTRGVGPTVDAGRSFKLGVIRLTERFVKTDPLEPRDERKLVRHIDAEIGKLPASDRPGPASSASSARRARSSASARWRPRPRARAGRAAAQPPDSRRSRSAGRARISSALDLEKRLRVPGLEPRRADLAVAGAILLDEILRRLGADEITLVRPVAARRAGARLHRAAPQGDRAGRSLPRRPPAQRRSSSAERCNYWPEHAQQVARLAIGLFDQTRAIHGLTDREREWLEYAAILHDIGVPHQLRSGTTSTRITS